MESNDKKVEIILLLVVDFPEQTIMRHGKQLRGGY